MPVLPESAWSIRLPKMTKVRQLFPDEHISDIPGVVKNEIESELISGRIISGQTIAVLVGSRGIHNLDVVVKSAIDALKSLGAKPFIVPSMGSHGGGVAENQRAILEGYGITESTMRVPIKTSMETVKIGSLACGVPVYFDKNAWEADGVVPINRVKPHTDFNGPIESGLCKMLAIGGGKHTGCSSLHSEGFDRFSEIIPQAARLILSEKNVPFGIAIVENAHDNTHTIRAIPGSSFLESEPQLLALSKSLMPRLQFDHIDVLIVDEIGKDVTGAGMDPNIIGRLGTGRIPDFNGPEISRIVALGLTEGTHHNALGIGLADFTTKAVLASIDLESTYANAVACCDTMSGFIPIALDTEEEAIRAAVHTCLRIDHNDAKIVRIRNTLSITEIDVSENLLDYCRNSDGFSLE